MKQVPLKDGFDYNGVWITNPHYEETGRFKFDTEHDAAIHYGFPKNLHALWVATEPDKLHKAAVITEQFLGSRESCEDKDAWDDFNKALEEEVD